MSERDEIREMIEEIVNSTEIRTQNRSYVSPNHGSSTGEIVNMKEYFNPVKSEWTPIKNDVITSMIVEKYRRKVQSVLKEMYQIPHTP